MDALKPHPQDGLSRPLEREPRPVAPATAEIEAKLKEAQATLLEAEARLRDPHIKGTGERAATLPHTNGDDLRLTSEPASARPVATNEARPRVAERLAAPVDVTRTTARTAAPSEPATERLPENVAAMLCYLFGWASGLVFLLVDRRPFVRFHAAQSVAVFATLSILLLALSGFFLGAFLPGLGGALLVVRRLLELVWLVAEVVLILKAAGGERFRVRLASQYADRAADAAR